MRLSRTDLVPVLTIVAGGAIGLSLSLNFLLLPPPGDVPALALAPVVAPVPPVPPAVPVAPIPPMAPIPPIPRIPPVPPRARVEPSLVRARVGVVTGRITDGQTGRSIAAAQVFISSLDVGGLTQQNGRYLLQNVPAGTYTLSVARIGYQTTWVRIVVVGDQTVEQDLTISANSEDATFFPYRFAPTVRAVPASPTAAEITQRQEELLRRLREDANN